MNISLQPAFVFLVSALAVLGSGCENALEPEGGAEGSERSWECQDGADNDQDGLVDCEESSCAEADVCTNEPPTAPVLGVWPENPVADRDVLCVLEQPAEDPDGDALAYRFSWSRSGGTPEVDGYVLPVGVGAEGEAWTCMAVATDGTDEGTWAEVQFTFPGVEGGVVEVCPSEPGPTDDLICTISQVSNYVGGANDPLSYGYTWSKRGAGATDFSTVPGQIASVLQYSETSEGDEWRCDVQIAGAHSVYDVISDTVEITDSLCETFEIDDGGYTAICREVGIFKSGEEYLARNFCEDREESILIVYEASHTTEILDFAYQMSSPPTAAGYEGYIWLGIEKSSGGSWQTIYGGNISYMNWALGTQGAGPEHKCAAVCAFGDSCACEASSHETIGLGEWCPMTCDEDLAVVACEGGDHH